MIERLVALVVLLAILIVMLVGIVAYGHPLGFIPLFFCDILGLESLSTCA